MNKTTKWLFTLSISTLALVGCSNSISKEDTDRKEQEMSKEFTTEVTLYKTEDIAIEDLKKLIQVGDSREDIESLIGKASSTYINEEYTHDIYPVNRYDGKQIDGYEFMPDYKDESDLKGIADGKMTYQLFIEYDDNDSLYGYMLYYEKSDTTLEKYRVFHNGQVDIESFEKSYLQDFDFSYKFHWDSIGKVIE